MTHPQVGGLRRTESRTSPASSRTKRGDGAHRRQRNPRLESLEARQLLSVAPQDGSAWESAAQARAEALPFFLPPQLHLRDEAGGLLTGPTAGDPRQIAVDYLRANALRLGLTQADIETAAVTDQYTDRPSGVTHIYFAQTLDGLRLANANLNINVTADGRVINAGSSFVTGLDRGSTALRAPSLDARAAVKAAGAALGLKGTVDPAAFTEGEAFRAGEAFTAPAISLDRIEPKLIYVPQAGGGLELSWNVQLRTPDGQHWYDAAVSADDGQLVWGADWADGASYNVLPAPSENPADLGRAVVVDPQDSEASPFGWHDTNGAEGAEFTDTRGNNVSAQEDADANDSGGYRPSGGPNLVFDFPFNTAQEPTSYRDAAITNLFYWNNLLHDVHYQYGFDEPSGNFQVNNYGRGGAGSDAVQADAQDGSGFDNANMFTPPDGFSPRMQQFLFTSSSPMRDSSMSNDIITHEYGHGVSNRLTGGPANANALDALQSGGMGEGWSDWWALMFTQDSADTKFAAYPAGTYVLNQPENGPGIRSHPYSFDMAINPLTLAAFNTNPEVHASGEIWASTLWDMNWLLIDKYGYDPNIAGGYQNPGGGNLLALQLVMDGLKLQPANPTFTQARDAILLADTMLTGSANQKEIWTAFARRGFGLSADVDDGNGANSFAVIEAFDLPIFDLHVTTTSPAENAIVATRPTVFDVDMSQVFDPATANAADLLVNGIPAANVQILDENSLRFSYAASPVVVEGPQTMTMAEGALLRASDGAASLDFSRVFYYDTLRMEITGTNPASGASVQLPFTTVDVDVNEAIASASVDAGDLELSQGTVAGVQLLDADTVRFTLAGLNAEGTLNFQLDAGAFTDQFGNPSVAYGGSWSLDFGAVPFAGSLGPLAPFGGLAYSGITTGIIGVDGDTDTFTLDLEAGQLLAFRATSASGWQPRVTVRNPQGNVIVTAGGASSGTLLVPATLLDTAGEHTIEVAAPASATGAYTVEALLNVDYESELLPAGAANDTRETAQPLESLFTSPDGVARRGMVLGRAPSAGDLPYEVEPNDTPSQPNSLMNNLAETRGDAYQLHIDGEQNNSSDTDWFNLGMLDAGDVVTISLSGVSSSRGTLSDPLLYFYQRTGGVLSLVNFSDDGRPGTDSLIYEFTIPATAEYLVEAQDFSFFEVGTYDLNVYLKNIGAAPQTSGNLVNESEGNNDSSTADDFSTSWRQVVRESLTGGEIASPEDEDVFRVSLVAGDVITVAALGGGGFAPTIEIIPSRGPIVATDYNSFGLFDRAEVFAYRAVNTGAYYVRVGSAVGVSGAYELKVELSSPVPPPAAVIAPDYYSVELQAGQSLSLLIDRLDQQPLELQLQDAAGNVLATGAAQPFATDFAISDFQAQAAGTYYAVVLAGRAPDYRLLAAVDTTVGLELNDDIAAAQLVESRRVGGAQRVLGRVAPAAKEVITYSELPFQPADGLTFNHVTYDFKVNGADSGDAHFGSGGPGATKYGDGIGLEGAAAGILTMEFESPTGDLQFGVLLSTGGVVARGVVVDLFDANGGLIAQVPVDLRDEGFFFAEALFAYSGAPVSRAVLDFNSASAARFFIDNLTFEFGAGVDVFPVTVVELGTLLVETETPFSGAGAPANALNPRLRLLDGNGNVIAEDDDSAADGKNARLAYPIPRGVNTFYVEVTASPLDPNVRGEYLLKITNPAAILSPYTVRSVDPGDGERLRAAPQHIEVEFGGNFVVSTLDAGDLLVDGVPATAVELLDGARARFTPPSGLTEGSHTITLPEGVLTDLQGTPLAAFASDFALDFTAPRMVGASVSNDEVLPVGEATFTFTFAEAMRVESLSFDDFQLFGTLRAQFLAPTSFGWDPSGTVLNVAFSGLWEDSFQLALFSREGAFTDVAGNKLDGEANAFPLPPNQSGDGQEGGDFVVRFTTDLASTSFPTPLAALGPLGTASYRGTAIGVMSFAGDVDEFTLQLDAGQTLTLTSLVPGLRPSLTLRGPSGNTLATAVAPATGADAVLRMAPVSSAGLYTIAFASTDGATGAFSFAALLNSDVETEEYGGAADDDRAHAQDLAASFAALGAGGASQANVLGLANLPPGLLPFEQEPNDTRETADAAFANFVPAADLYQISVHGSMFSGRTGVDWFDLGPMSAGDSLTVNVAGAGSGRGTLGGVFVELYAGTVDAMTLMASDYFGNGAGGDALIYQYQVPSPDGYFVKVAYDNFNTGTYELSVFLQNVSRGPRTDGTLTTESEPNNTPAQADQASNAWRKAEYAAFTNALTSASDSDHFAYDFQAGDLVTTIVNGMQGLADTRLVWRGPNGATLGFDDGFSGPFFQNSLLYGLRIPTTGRYTLEVLSFADGPYTAEVYLTSPTAPPTAEFTGDFYRLQLVAGEQIAVSVKAQSGVENELSIQNEAGDTLFTAALTAENLGAVIPEFVAPSAGVYYLVVRGATGQQYALSVARSAALDVEENDDLASAQPLQASVALGFVQGAEATPPDDDWYRVEAVAGQYLVASTMTRGGGEGEFVNQLDPALELYSANGGLLAANDNGPDGRNSLLTYLATTSGTYYIRVRAATNQGEYVLFVDRVAEVLPGDTDFDGDVDLDDLNNVRNHFGGAGVGDTAPFDGDVDLDDLNAVRNNLADPPPIRSAGRAGRVAIPRPDAAFVDALFGATANAVHSRSVDELFSLLGHSGGLAARKARGRSAS